MALSPEQQDRLVGLLVKTLDFNDLEWMVYLGTGDGLYDEYVGMGDPKKVTLQKLIQALERNAVTDRFLRIVYRERPLQASLRQLIASLFPEIPTTASLTQPLVDFQKAGTPDGKPSEGPALQRIVRQELPMLDAQIWIDRFESLKRQVCRIEADGSPLGSGFLVGPSAVLTNWHVVREHLAAGATASLACRFDYQRRQDGGEAAGVTFAIEGVAAQRPCSLAELGATPDTPPPVEGELDYALLKLTTPAGGRGHIRLTDPPPVDQGASIVILQHPNGEPMRFAIDTDSVLGFFNNGLRLRYRTNTLPGSSGSPCFSLNLDLIALHHLGSTGAAQSPFNQGVPIGLIRQSLLAQGAAPLLGD